MCREQFVLNSEHSIAHRRFLYAQIKLSYSDLRAYNPELGFKIRKMQNSVLWEDLGRVEKKLSSADYFDSLGLRRAIIACSIGELCPTLHEPEIFRQCYFF